MMMKFFLRLKVITVVYNAMATVFYNAMLLFVCNYR